MKNSNLSRRDFMKATLAGLGAAFLAACQRLANPSAPPVEMASSLPTDTPEPTATNTSTSTPTATPTPTEIPSIKLLTPEDGANLNPVGRVTFAWEAAPGAARYRLEITLPSGQVVSFDSTGLSRDQYLEAIQVGGRFQWRVVALDADGGILATSSPFLFEKPEKAPASGRDGGGSGNGSDGSSAVSLSGTTDG